MFHNFIAKLSEKGKKILYITLAFAALALMDRLFLGPVLDQLKTIEDKIVEQEDTIKRDLRFLAYKNKIVKNIEVFSKYFEKTQKDADVVNRDFLSVVEKLATKNKVNLIKSNPSEVKKENNFTQYFATLDCSGQLKDVISFMHSINSTEELLKITRFNLTPKRGTEGEVTASMTIAKMIVNPDIFVSQTSSPKKAKKK